MMTLAELDVSLNEAPMSLAQKLMAPVLMSYEVVLKDPWGNWFFGKVVTFCSIEHWSEMRDYQIISIGEVHRADASERTDLE